MLIVYHLKCFARRSGINIDNINSLPKRLKVEVSNGLTLIFVSKTRAPDEARSLTSNGLFTSPLACILKPGSNGRALRN